MYGTVLPSNGDVGPASDSLDGWKDSVGSCQAASW